MLKRNGYLMIDVAVAVALFSILSLTIITIYSSYINFKVENNIKLESIELFNAVAMEVKHNVTFSELNNLDFGTNYYVITKEVKDIMENSLVDLLVITRDEEEYCKIRVLPMEYDNAIDIEVEYFKEQGKVVYENKEVIRKYSFIK